MKHTETHDEEYKYVHLYEARGMPPIKMLNILIDKQVVSGL